MPPGPRARLDRAAVVDAALATLEERGLDGLSGHAVARRLGVRQPALYHHFRDMADLLDAVAATVLDRSHTERLPVPGDTWADFLTRNARSLHRAMLSVRDGARLVASSGSRAPNVANAVAQVAFLESEGFSGPDAVLAFIAVSRYTIGATLEQQSAPGGNAIEVAEPDVVPGAEHLAELAAAVAALGPEHEFEVGLAALVRGLAPRS
ncbi:TetR/AcrR family transcriptional regulator C-terminal domain-containing protein [Phycicoccus sonneratiae]|uniref:TetR/AcrR family transcriptional regulator C-terminal domain-containing protein n=1 Tax=Phycicoccus sonneratiae TaxID=2807628 RepID=A0ABS2CG03_9MICO|nr:TetR/AcrR family transcriptional regulator C-terminal domain-containing protein [Phycicoccus sonneraticus]MBM6398808.1 TetR/AcrR family transcriptional regulator C-terminal domain-containing protein [Phycicoccus sonneraticus]